MKCLLPSIKSSIAISLVLSSMSICGVIILSWKLVSDSLCVNDIQRQTTSARQLELSMNIDSFSYIMNKRILSPYERVWLVFESKSNKIELPYIKINNSDNLELVAFVRPESINEELSNADVVVLAFAGKTASLQNYFKGCTQIAYYREHDTINNNRMVLIEGYLKGESDPIAVLYFQFR